ncbi:MAG: hypothetical protein KBC64_05270, partial [Simkaniaceae bacterium]|nr:hypothetical protein [Simkaniaceae bacterium]
PTISAAILAGVALGMWIGSTSKGSLSSRTVSQVEDATQNEQKFTQTAKELRTLIQDAKRILTEMEDKASDSDSDSGYTSESDSLADQWIAQNCKGESPHDTD